LRILVKISHPGHVHFYKNFINEMEKKGHKIFILSSPRKMAIRLLELYNLEYETYNSEIKYDFIRIRDQLQLNYETWKNVVRFKPDFLTGIGGTSVSHVSRFTEAFSVIFTDTEHAKFQNNITFPFADRICTPECYTDDLGSKQIRYPGYHELAYLHPNRFTPDPSVLDYIDADRDDKIVILRLVSWEAVHDVGDSGFSDVVDVVRRLESTGAEVVITAEGDIPEEVEYCQSKIPPHKMHDLMYYSDLFIGESATMASESAMLGTPAIFVSSSRRGYTDELEEKYGLVFNFSGENRQKRGLGKALDILEYYDENKWENRRKKMFEDKIDVTEFMLKIFRIIEKRNY